MAIFSSRTLQRMLEETTMLIPKGKRREYLRDINKTVDGLSKEWELAIAWAFSRIAAVTYEPKGPGTRRPDLAVGSGPANLLFVADITTVSDRGGIEIENPVEEFMRGFDRIVKTRNLRRNSFFVRFQRDEERTEGDRVILSLPPFRGIEEFVTKYVAGFLDKVQGSADLRHLFNQDGIVIAYDPRHQYSMQAHPAYKAVRPLDRNAVANAIGEKAGQLRESQFNCAHGVFLCDGGCELLFEHAFVERIAGKVFADQSESVLRRHRCRE